MVTENLLEDRLSEGQESADKTPPHSTVTAITNGADSVRAET